MSNEPVQVKFTDNFFLLRGNHECATWADLAEGGPILNCHSQGSQKCGKFRGKQNRCSFPGCTRTVGLICLKIGVLPQILPFEYGISFYIILPDSETHPIYIIYTKYHIQIYIFIHALTCWDLLNPLWLQGSLGRGLVARSNQV